MLKKTLSSLHLLASHILIAILCFIIIRVFEYIYLTTHHIADIDLNLFFAYAINFDTLQIRQ